MASKKKKSSKKTVKAQSSGKKAAKKAGKKVGKKVAKGLLGKIAQRGAQLILDSGVLGEPPRRKAAKKKRSRSR